VFLFSVSGACSRSGKTALAEAALRAMAPGAAAVKFTVTENVFERCPRGTPCVVCDIDVPFRLVEDPRVLSEAGTDTCRLAAAGAQRVVWAIARQSAAPLAWQAVLERLPPAGRVVIEGSTIVELARPDVLAFVAHPFLSTSRWKPTSAALIRRADVVVVNRESTEQRAPSRGVMEELERRRGRRDVRVADLSRPLREWAPDLAERLVEDGVAAQ
jgi:molybdopterin-guanine dinucleotide biosynthesis protein